MGTAKKPKSRKLLLASIGVATVTLGATLAGGCVGNLVAPPFEEDAGAPRDGGHANLHPDAGVDAGAEDAGDMDAGAEDAGDTDAGS